jgi:hypothetical protein
MRALAERPMTPMRVVVRAAQPPFERLPLSILRAPILVFEAAPGEGFLRHFRHSKTATPFTPGYPQPPPGGQAHTKSHCAERDQRDFRISDSQNLPRGRIIDAHHSLGGRSLTAKSILQFQSRRFSKRGAPFSKIRIHGRPHSAFKINGRPLRGGIDGNDGLGGYTYR